MAEVVVGLQALLELQQRQDNPAEPAITGFTWRIHKYLVSTTKRNADQGGISSTKTLKNNMNRCSSTNKEGSNQGEMPCQHGEVVFNDLKCFTYYELRRATKNFGIGSYLTNKSYVKLYKGPINKTTYYPSDTTSPVAIKSIKFYQHALQLDLKEFSHPNLEKLIGYCLKGQPGEQLLLVYDYMGKGNFEDLLNSGAVRTLPLITKVKIAVGIARGIVFLHKTQYQDGFSESRLDRHSILLDEDFTAKLSGYDVTKLVFGCYPQPSKRLERSYYAPWVELPQLQSNLSGFTVVFMELLIGKKIYNEDKFKKIDDLFLKHVNLSLVDTAKTCFEICNKVDSESKMLRILKKYEYSSESDEKFIIAQEELFIKPTYS
ncbi:hypothetical protein L2E82_39153 [Cichorium intybus]|uniref:Uncharacterized protein n=1 Tax=Cichorium intybus TaxID=13427 RepID=A0ACB9AIQ7_CICIN|nr:hypothetical protein L2E82_39153 [Cichorium intybus]